MAGIDKVGHLLDIPVDPRRGRLSLDDKACSLEWSDLKLSVGANQRYVPAGQLTRGSSIAITGNDLVTKTMFAESVAGLVEPHTGIVTVAEMDAIHAAAAGKGRLVAVAHRVEVFRSTIVQNVELGRAGIGEDRVRDCLKAVGLWNLVHELPNGVATMLETGGYPLSKDQLARLMLARSIAARPRLVVIDSLLDDLPPSERADVLRAMRQVTSPCTFVVTTNDQNVAAVCDRQLEIDALG
jgi:putative ABC transport system ATP-binding protein